MAAVRTLLVSSHFQPMRGGSAVVYDQLARHGGGDIAVLSCARDYATNRPLAGAEAFDRAAPYPVHRLPLLRPPDETGAPRGAVGEALKRLFVDVPILLRSLIVTAWLSLRFGARVVCIGDLISLGWMAWPLHVLLWRKVVLYIHGEEVSVGDAGFFFRLRAPVLRRADAIVTVSTYTRDLLVSAMGIARDKICVISNGVDTGRFNPAPIDEATRARYGVRDRRTIVAVGRLIERKGFDRLVEAMPRVLEAVPDACCLIAGDGPLRDALKARIATLGLGDRVRLLGLVSDDDLLTLYRLGEVFAMPNRTTENGDTEGFGLVFLEANACGKPVVAGRAGGAVDAVTDGVNGLLVDGNDAGAIADALVRLLTDRALHARLSASALVVAAENSWATRAQAYRALCDRLVATGAPQPSLAKP